MVYEVCPINSISEWIRLGVLGDLDNKIRSLDSFDAKLHRF